ncbi:MAG TPA: serine/threonine-protein kinase [Kofleriaceae bacterium]
MPNDQYQLGELLGRGGMGQVHAARHRSGRLVAVKRVRNTLSSDRFVIERLGDEARLLCAISHPNVVRALDHGTSSDGMPFLVMDRAHGTPLNHLIAQRGPLPLDRLAAIAAQLFAGLTAIHDAQIVHADLKSHNVLVDDVDIVTIIDFGLARTLIQDPATVGLIAGTPAYMAPEVIAGAHPTIAADVYSAAAIVYEMLTGTTPFTGHLSTILTRQLSEPVQPPSQRIPSRRISPAVDRAVLRALDASPAARFASVTEFAAALLGALAGRSDPELAGGSEVFDPPIAQRTLTPVAQRTLTPVAQRTLTPVAHAATERIGPRRIAERIAGPLAGRPDDGSDERTDAMISAALSHAQRLIEDRRIPQAMRSLEGTLAALSPLGQIDASCTGAWRIETVLAALYDSIGKQERARRLALVAYRHALRSGCPLAEGRAGALVDRLVARSRRLARGSVGSPR